MKTIKIKGIEFQYEIELSDEWMDQTYFYLGTEIYNKRKYLMFGPKISKIRPKYVFRFMDNIESCKFTKNELRSKLEHLVEINVERQKEIDKGELI